MKATFPITVLENKETSNLIVSIMGHTVFLNRESHLAMYDCLYNALETTWKGVKRTKIDVSGKTKGDIMKIAYRRRNVLGVDSSLPQDVFNKLGDKEAFWHVWDYNDHSLFGELVDLRKKAMENGIELITE